MARYTAGLVCGVLLVLLMLHVAALLLPTPTLPHARWVGEMLLAKEKIVSAREKPQMILAGGSNVHFGFSAESISREHGIEVINLGTHAGLGRKYMLGWLMPRIKKGDLVVFALEYELYGPEAYDNALYQQALAFDQPYYRALPVVEKVKLLARVTFKDWREIVQNKFGRVAGPITGYSVSTINPLGDETANTSSSTEPWMREKLRASVPRTYVLDPGAMIELAAFKAYVEALGAGVVLVYPNILDRALDEQRNAVALSRIEEAGRAAGMPLIGGRRERSFALSEAYDTIYHPSHDAQLRNSRILMKQLEHAHVTLPMR